MISSSSSSSLPPSCSLSRQQDSLFNDIMLRTRRQSVIFADPANSSISSNANAILARPCGCWPNECDILCGKDKTYSKHLGNRAFRQRIEATRLAYKSAPTKHEKMKITRDIVAYFKQKMHARFLKPENGMWIEIRDTTARDKVSHALRFSARNDGDDIGDEDDDGSRSSTTNGSSNSSSLKCSESSSSSSTNKNVKKSNHRGRTKLYRDSLSSSDGTMTLVSSMASKNNGKAESSFSSVMVDEYAACLHSSSNNITKNANTCTTTGQGQGIYHETRICTTRATAWGLVNSTALPRKMAALDSIRLSPLTTTWMLAGGATRFFASSVAATPTMTGASYNAVQNASSSSKVQSNTTTPTCCEQLQEDLDAILQEPLILDEWESSYSMIEKI
jgi:hypothetical protein